MSQSYKTVATKYLEMGFNTIPIKFKEKIPSIDWKPFQQKRVTMPDIENWDRMYQDFNIAVLTGEISGVTIVDIDGETGFESAKTLELPPTLTVKTGKGQHLYYKYCANPAVTNKVGLIPGIDIRNNGGYVVAPPSVHARGTTYEFIDPSMPIADLPACIIALCEQQAKPQQGQEGSSNAKVDITAVGEGSRNSTLTSLAGTLHHTGLPYDIVFTTLLAANSKFNQPLDEREVETIAKSVTRYNREERMHKLTDVGVVERFIDRYGDTIIFNSDSGKWYIFNGTFWERQPTDVPVWDRMLSLVRSIPSELDDTATDDQRKSYDMFARKCEGARPFANLMSMASTRLSKPQVVFDSNTWVFNTTNVTFDLRSGTYRAHNPGDMLSKCSPIAYDPEAKCPTWDTFLSEIFNNDTQLIRYMQRVIGYCLTGDVSEQVFFTLYGTGANGKSVFIDTIRYIIGDYGQQTDFTTFLAKQGDGGIRNDIASLVGCRFVTASESSRKKTLDDALIKQITGGDAVRARFLHKEFFEFKPHMKIMLITNHKPNITDDSVGMWRRVRLVPFSVTIPAEKRDRSLTGKLLAEAPGIFNWCLDGFKEWRKHGLGRCSAVEAETDDYRETSDSFGSFLDDMVVVNPDSTVMGLELYGIYCKWCEANGESAVSSKFFGMRMRERGFEKLRMTAGMKWRGVAIKGQEF